MSVLTDLITSRLTFGPRFGDPQPLTDANIEAWLSAQLSAPVVDDPTVVQLFNKIYFWPTPVKRTTKITYIFQSASQLWSISDWYEGQRAFMEVMAVRWTRAAFSPWQIFEVMVDFWQNHFSIDFFQEDPFWRMLPAYDRTIRANALGNFRSLLGAVSKSVNMMLYLNQNLSTIPIPNENFSREVMELHTLGVARYFGKTTPPGMETSGYSDQDVQQLARILTGWTIADGTHGAGDQNDGSFIFVPAMHDTGPKTIFNISIPAGGGEDEGELLLDYLAAHPGTAENIATKLYIRFVGDTPPSGDPLVAAMANTFTQYAAAPDQIARVIGTLVADPRFVSSAAIKVKTPFEFMISEMRATGCDVNGASGAIWPLLPSLGAILFGWPTPKGMPDIASAWTGTGGMVGRWAIADRVTLAGILIDNGQDLFSSCLNSKPPLKTPQEAAELVGQLILGNLESDSTRKALDTYAASPEVLGASNAFTNSAVLEAGLRRLVGAVAAAPEFQMR